MTPPNPPPPPCGCRVDCPLHASAPALLAALENIIKIRADCTAPTADAVAMGYESEHVEQCCRWCKARAVIKAARP